MFTSSDFTFDGISNISKNVYLVTFEGDILESKGTVYKREVSATDGFSHKNPFYKTSETPPEPITLNLMLLNEKKEPTKWSEQTIIDIKKWLIKDSFAPFISKDNPNYTYYFMCTRVEKKLSVFGIGVLEIELQPMTHYVYDIKTQVITCNSTTSSTVVTMVNPSTIEYAPLIKITNLGEQSDTIKVNKLEVTNVKKNEVVYIDCLMRLGQYENEEMFFNYQGEYLTLPIGSSQVTVQGNCKVEIMCEYPISL